MIGGWKRAAPETKREKKCGGPSQELWSAIQARPLLSIATYKRRKAKDKMRRNRKTERKKEKGAKRKTQRKALGWDERAAV